MISFRAEEKLEEIINILAKKTDLSRSQLIRCLFEFFSENYIKLLIILEEIKENDKKK